MKRACPLGVYFAFARGLLFGSSLNIEMRSKPVFNLAILLAVIPTSCIFQIHMYRLPRGSSSGRGLLSEFTLG